MVDLRVLIFSRKSENQAELLRIIRSLPPELTQDMETCCASDYDDLRRDLVKTAYDMVIVSEPGAYGMEVCIGIRKISTRVALAWFSDDPAFAAQSYRLNCTYFAELPPTERTVGNVFSRMAEHKQR